MKIIIIGAGAAGLMAGYYAAQNADVLLLEKNQKCGKKIYITGKGRCNVCNACSNDEFLKNVLRNPRFLYPSLTDFNPFDLIALFEQWGCPIKVERGRRAYPVSEKASDITFALQNAYLAQGGKIRYNCDVKQIVVKDTKVVGVRLQNEEFIACDRVIVATGGLSYTSTGSTGDGYKLLAEHGHHIMPTQQALVPLNSSADWVKALTGLSLKNVTLTLKEGKKVLYQELGEMLFTHFGISGPLVLSASSFINNIKEAKITLNLKPALNFEMLESRILREIEQAPNKQIIHILYGLFPQRLAHTIADLCGIDAAQQANKLSKELRRKLIENTLALPLPISDFRSFNEAVITRGGADCKQFIPKTMESKLVHGLYAAGEVLDIDALTGGYNLFVAFASGRTAGRAASLETEN
ncbi:MAG: NAD(P)/FAD-dependent oxidoreductase [Eubacteriales bacterium]|nr:NAD(P)/FAD-dependent oxidoreductase [Eubacteriales bacterium]